MLTVPVIILYCREVKAAELQTAVSSRAQSSPENSESTVFILVFSSFPLLLYSPRI